MKQLSVELLYWVEDNSWLLGYMIFMCRKIYFRSFLLLPKDELLIAGSFSTTSVVLMSSIVSSIYRVYKK